ncbi:MAG: hypothetical protein HC880_06675 [Bacteroidia bacterium]|nr:hypothetical protein [Bacteroidia bacterium]
MNEEIDEFLKLIKLYQKRVAEAVMLLNQKAKKDKGFQQRERTGYLGDNLDARYIFHGTGCLVHLSYGETVDFEFGPEGRCDGFDIGFLTNFAKMKTDQFPDIKGFEHIKSLTEELKKEGKVLKPDELSNTYYLKEDWSNLNPISFQPND